MLRSNRKTTIPLDYRRAIFISLHKTRFSGRRTLFNHSIIIKRPFLPPKTTETQRVKLRKCARQVAFCPQTPQHHCTLNTIKWAKWKIVAANVIVCAVILCVVQHTTPPPPTIPNDCRGLTDFDFNEVHLGG